MCMRVVSVGLIFANFPSKVCPPASASSRESISPAEEEKTTEVHVAAEGTTCQTTGTDSYSELGDGQVMEILTKHLAAGSSPSGTTTRQQSERESALHHNSDLVLFKGAI